MNVATLIQQLDRLRTHAEEEFAKAATPDAVEALRVSYLGKKSQITHAMKLLAELSPEDRPAAGKAINDVKKILQDLFQKQSRQIADAEKQRKMLEERIDVTLPGRCPPIGKKHPLTQVAEEIQTIFVGLGFAIAEGPEVELDYYNFEALNFPKNHPSRDMQDTFFVSEEVSCVPIPRPCKCG